MPKTEFDRAKQVIANLWQVILFKEDRLRRHRASPVNGSVHTILALEAQIAALQEAIQVVASEFGLPPSQPRPPKGTI